MKRRDLIAHLLTHGCVLIREGSKHAWWGHLTNNKRTAIPRHGEVNNNTAKSACRELGIPTPTKK